MESNSVPRNRALVPVNTINHRLPGKVGQWAMNLDNKITDTISLTSGKNTGRWWKFSRQHPKLAKIIKPIGEPLLKGLNFIHDKGIGQLFKIPTTSKVGALLSKVPLKGPMLLAAVTDAAFKTVGAVSDAITVGKEKGILAGLWQGVESLGKGVASIAGGALAAAGAVTLAGVAATGPIGWVVGGAAYLAGSWLTGKALDGLLGTAEEKVQERPYRATDSLRPQTYDHYPSAFNTPVMQTPTAQEFAAMSPADQSRILEEALGRISHGDFRGWH